MRAEFMNPNEFLTRNYQKPGAQDQSLRTFKCFFEFADKWIVNIKNLIGNIGQVTSPAPAAKTDRLIKTDNTQDRDANGQQLYHKERKKEKMTDEQFEKAVAILSEKHFIKDMHWTVSAMEEGGIKYACVQDATGKTIRKIIEFDLWEVFEDVKSAETKGQLLKRTA